jgi:hypothetical protein
MSLRRTGRASLDAPSSTGQHMMVGKTIPLAWLVTRFTGRADRLEGVHHSRHNATIHRRRWPVTLCVRATTHDKTRCPVTETPYRTTMIFSMRR